MASISDGIAWQGSGQFLKHFWGWKFFDHIWRARSLVHNSPLHEDCFRFPLFCPVVTNNVHWRVAEKAGFRSWSQFFKTSSKFLILGLGSTGLILSGFYLNRENYQPVVTETEEVRQDFENLRNGFFTLMVPSFVLFGLKFLRPITGKLIRAATISRNNALGSPISCLVETNLLRLLLNCLFGWHLLQARFMIRNNVMSST